MIPKIDYDLLGQAVAEYASRGYTYVEVPWAVSEKVIRATLPSQFPALTMGVKPEALDGTRDYPRNVLETYDHASCLVGSAEQGFLSLDLKPGKYVGVTPCFRPEPHTDLLHQIMFMKVELFCKFKDAITDNHVERVLTDAREVMGIIGEHDAEITEVKTHEGYDLEVGGIEVGSYGKRSWEGQDWVYGTGLALPRFSVAVALSTVI